MAKYNLKDIPDELEDNVRDMFALLNSTDHELVKLWNETTYCIY